MMTAFSLPFEQPERSLPVSEAIWGVAAALSQLPLGSAADIGGVQGVGVSGVYNKLWELAGLGYAECMQLGWSRQRTTRWWLTEEALIEVGLLGGSWHQDWGRSVLLERLPLVEWFYHVAGSLDMLGPLVTFRWLDGLVMDAVARFRDGWVAFLWSGLWQGERSLRERIERLGPQLIDVGVVGQRAWPGLLCFVVSDEWQRELVWRVVHQYRLESRTMVWCAADGSRSGVSVPGVSRGWVYQPVRARDLGNWPWSMRSSSAVWGQQGSGTAGRVLEAVAEWNGCDTEFLRGVVGDGPKGKTVYRALSQLVKAGLVRREREGRAYRYFLTSKGGDAMARRDRVAYGRGQGGGRGRARADRGRIERHELGLMDLMGRFRQGGLPVACGWRTWEHLGGSGGLAPDGVVLLRDGPYGPGWYYVEYELRARGVKRVVRKLRSYLSERRQDRWPVIMVARDARTEGVFQEVGVEGGLALVTGNVERLAQCEVLGDTGCWSCYGGPAALG